MGWKISKVSWSILESGSSVTCQINQLNLSDYNGIQFIFTSNYFLSMMLDQLLSPQGPNLEQVDMRNNVTYFRK